MRAERDGQSFVIRTFPLEQHGDPEGHARVRRELVMQKDIHHPNVWAVLEWGFHDNGTPYLVLEDCGGHSLRDEMQDGGTLDMDRWRGMVSDVLRGLEALQGAGVVHRQLEPDRIWVSSDGVCKIFDFGLSIGPDVSRLTPSGVSLGTPRYIAPEQLFNAHHVDGRSDLYSLGVVAYELLTGHLPIEGVRAAEHVSRLACGDLDPLSKWRADVPDSWATWLTKMLATTREHRFANATEALEGLRALS
jgi:serine/threonine-protein kinase